MSSHEKQADKTKDAEDGELDISDVTGDCGPWQVTIFIALFFASFPGTWMNLAVTFYAPNIDFWCAPPEPLNGSALEEWKNASLPVTSDGKFSQCDMYAAVNGSATSRSNLTVKCGRWQYDRSFYTNTIVEEWDLVCDRAWLVSLCKSVYMVGFLISVLVLGQLSDRFGRRPIILSCIFLKLTSGVISAFSTSFIMFCLLRFFIALGSAGEFTTGFVLLMEVVSPKYRTIFGIAIEFGWAAAYVVLPGIAWLVRDWFWLQLTLSIPTLALFSLWWVLPESPRWLLTKGDFEAVKKELSKAAKKNKKSMENIDAALKKLCHKVEKEEEQKTTTRQYSIIDLFRTPVLNIRTLNLYFNWFVNSFVYYGLSWNTNDLGGDPYINFLISGAVEFPAYFFSIYAIMYFGRRPSLIGTMVIGGLACILTIPVPADMLWLTITLAMIGKLCISASFAIVYVFSAEIFPTVVRNVGVGSSSMCARVGSMIAPFVRELASVTFVEVPMTLYGAMSIASGLLVIALPETNHRKTPDTLKEAQEYGRTSNCKKASEENKEEKGNEQTSL